MSNDHYIDNPAIDDRSLEDAAAQEAEAERYQLLTDAMNECVAKNISMKALHTLAMETCFNAKDLTQLLRLDVARIQKKLEELK